MQVHGAEFRSWEFSGVWGSLGEDILGGLWDYLEHSRHDVVKHGAFNQGSYQRLNYPKNGNGLKLAMENRVQDINVSIHEYLKTIPLPGINVFEQVELYTKST